MTTVRQLITRLGFKADTSQLSKYKAMGDQAAATMGGLARKSLEAQRALNKGAAKARDELGRFTGQGTQAGAAASQLGGAGKAGGAGLMGLAGAAGVAVVALGGVLVAGGKVASFLYDLGKRSLKASADIETLRTRLTTMEGPDKAVQTLKELRKFAADTPFELNQIADSYARLTQAGFKVSKEDMRALGDLAAASGKGLEELTNAMLSASRGQSSMLDNFGIRGKAAGGKLQIDNANLKRTISTDPGDVLKLFTDAGKLDGTAGGMERLSKTYKGLTSTLKDNMTEVLVMMGEAGLLGVAKDATVGLIGLFQSPLVRTGAQALGRWMASLVGWAASWTKLAARALGVGAPVFEALIRLLDAFFGKMGETQHFESIEGFLASIEQSGAMEKLAGWIDKATARVKELRTQAAPIFTIFRALEDVWVFLNGGKSVLGEELKKIKEDSGLGQVIEEGRKARMVFDMLRAVVVLVLDALGKFRGGTDQARAGMELGLGDMGLTLLAELLEMTRVGLINLLAWVYLVARGIELVASGWNLFRDAATEAINTVSDLLGELASKLAGVLGGDFGGLGQVLSGVGLNSSPVSLAMAAAGRATGGTGQTTNTNQVSVGAVNVSIQGSSNMDPAQIAGAVGQGVRGGAGGVLEGAMRNRGGAGG